MDGEALRLDSFSFNISLLIGPSHVPTRGSLLRRALLLFFSRRLNGREFF